jgi:hypothetical protein
MEPCACTRKVDDNEAKSGWKGWCVVKVLMELFRASVLRVVNND